MQLNSSTNAKGERYYTAPLVPASYIEDEKFGCNPPGAFVFMFNPGYPNAKVPSGDKTAAFFCTKG